MSGDIEVVPAVPEHSRNGAGAREVETMEPVETEDPGDELLVCDGCYGVGKHCDTWGPWECFLCKGKGYVTRRFWEAYVDSFPRDIRERIRSRPGPARWRGA